MNINEKTHRNSNIDILRAFAILLVMIVHFPKLRQIFPILNPWSGVDLFFAISGYVVAKSFVPQFDAAIEKTPAEKDKAVVIANHTKAFFVRRFMRIMPPLIFALAFYLIFGIAVREPSLNSLTELYPELFAIFTYTENFFAGYRGATILGWHWSLAAEEQFYFLFPFFIAFFPSNSSRIRITLAGLALLTFVFRPFGSHWFGEPQAAMYLPQFRNDAIGYGFLVFAIHRKDWFEQIKFKLVVNNWFARTFCVLCLVTIIALAPQLSVSYNFAIPIISATSALLIILSLWSNQLLIDFWGISSVLEWIGLRSYGLYLFHIPIVRLVQHLEAVYLPSPPAYPLHLLIVILSLFAAVEACYQLVEKPTMRLGKRWSNQILTTG
jgi:peptidoglycan/LPS O-acetylase OafA/YrhL